MNFKGGISCEVSIPIVSSNSTLSKEFWMELRQKASQSVSNSKSYERIKDLTEYGRVVHAEMESILACGRAGIATQDTTMYCTTFPCHNCAKHIVAAGLNRVVYVEPYPKSKALELHNDSIHWTELNTTSGENRVSFDPFVGIGPRRFFDLFSMQQSSGYDLIRKKKATGKKTLWSIHDARLRLQMNPLSYIDLEGQANELFIRIADLIPGKDENP
jgi:deoxycytidylate deaminase